MGLLQKLQRTHGRMNRELSHDSMEIKQNLSLNHVRWQVLVLFILSVVKPMKILIFEFGRPANVTKKVEHRHLVEVGISVLSSNYE